MRREGADSGLTLAAVVNNNPVENVGSDDLACNVGNGGAVKTSPIALAVKAGSRVAVHWNSGVRRASHKRADGAEPDRAQALGRFAQGPGAHLSCGLQRRLLERQGRLEDLVQECVGVLRRCLT